jgi:hypothetical protein
VDATSRLISLFEHFNPYLQAAYALATALCAGLCFWSIARRFSVGLLLLGIGCVVACAQSTLFMVSAFQDGQPFLSFVPFDMRKQAYLYGRLLGPLQLFLFPTTVFLLAFEHRRRQKI